MQINNVLGWIAGIVVVLLLAQLLPETRCADGWMSPSIGEQGACSHHGGVDRPIIFPLVILAIGISVGWCISMVLGESNWFSRELPEIPDGALYLAIASILISLAIYHQDGIPVVVIGVIYIIAAIKSFIRKK